MNPKPRDKGDTQRTRKQVEWDDIDEVVDGGFLKKFQQDCKDGKTNLLEEPLEEDTKKSTRRSSTYKRLSRHSSTGENISKRSNRSSQVLKSEDKSSKEHNENSSKVLSNSSQPNNDRQLSSEERSQEQKRKRKNNMFVYNMHLQQKKTEGVNQSFAVKVVPDEFCEAKVLYDERAFNRLSPSNFIRVEPWKWKHFPYQERFQRLVKPESKMWIKRTSCKDIKSCNKSESAKESTWSYSNNTSLQPPSVERKRKNTKWRRSTTKSTLDKNIQASQSTDCE